jgi:hypothetical protein
MNAKRPTIDFVQVFCSNFESPRDFSGPRACQRNVEWQGVAGVSASDLTSARISRMSLEVLNLVLADEGAHLIPDPLSIYVTARPDCIVDARAIALVLLGCVPPLVHGEVAEIEHAIVNNVMEWQERAKHLLV